MRKFIIDTDTASDDAAAIMLAVLSKEIEIVGVTVVAGNVDLVQAGKNALMSLEVCHSEVPVYLGSSRPLFREAEETISVHGIDGMGDMDIIHPKRTVEVINAVDFILQTVRDNPDDIEIAVLGPATNIALAILNDRKTMSKVKHIWSMGTPGFGPGNATPVAEFNVFIDAEAYAIMLDAGIPTTIIGFDMCAGEIGVDVNELAYMAGQSEVGQFLKDATTVLLEFNRQTRAADMVDLPDAIAMAAALWSDFTVSKVRCSCHCCINDGPTYGQVIFYQQGRTYEAMPELKEANVEVISAVDEEIFTSRFMNIISKGV